LKARLRRSGWPVYEPYRNVAELEHVILADLQKLVRRLCPTESFADPLAKETATHQHFSASRCQVYIGRQGLFNRLDSHVSGKGPWRW
jgi:hypothetical protein